MSAVEDSIDLEPNWERWARARYWTWEEVEYLMVGLDHWKIRQVDPEVPLDLKDAERRQIRDALEFHFRTEDKTTYKITPPEALDIVQRAGLEPPVELVAAVRDARVLHERQDEDTEHFGGLRRKHNKLLKNFTLTVCARYNWTPKAGQPSPASAIKDDLQKLGSNVDDETILRRLREGLAALSDAERSALAKAKK